MDGLRFSKLEDRVEKLDDKIDIIKDDVSELKSDVKLFTLQVDRHVAGDNKIITEIMPIMAQMKLFFAEDMPVLKQIILEKQAEHLNEKKSVVKLNNWKLKVTILASILGALYTLTQLGWIKF